MTQIRLVVNGASRDLDVAPERSLLSVVRNQLGLSGTKYACLEGVCGACTVLLDGVAVRSCVTSVADADGRSVTTIEGLADGGRLHPVQQAFLDELAFQCGFCTPGQVMTAAALIERNARPDDDEIRDAMDGNVCRCGTYPRIRRAVRRASELAEAGAGGGPVRDRQPSVAPSPRLREFQLPRPRRPWDRQGTPDREYFEFLGDGLVVVLPPVQARWAGDDGTWFPNGGGWLHVGAGEVVTAFTGKVDVGQDNRTALSMIVADELRVPLGAVRLVMGDTDVCPFDMGTFGSRSMADAGRYMAVVAAAARQALIGLAAERWETDAADLVARDCRVVRSTGASIGYGELLAGSRRVELAAMAENTESGGPRALIGSPTSRVTGVDIVTGAHTYVLDITRPVMLHGLVLRPPSFGATLRFVDVAPATALPGVVAVAEGDFVGVAAPDIASARTALKSIEVDWSIDPEPSEDGIVEYLRDHPVDAEGWEGVFDEAWGDVDAGLASSGRRLDATYTAAYLAHVPLETRDAVAEWEDGRLTVWTGTQRPFGVRAEVSKALGVAEEDVRVIVPDTGGGFGGKHSGEAAVEAARLARVAARPVRIRWSREEEMTWAYFRPFAVIDIRAGLADDGSVAAWAFTNTNSGPMAILPPYSIPNAHIRYQPADSPLRVGSYRALSATANTFARESAMDELAHLAGADPLEFRLRHLPDERLAAAFRAAAGAANWDHRPAQGSGRGMGIAGCIEKGGHVATVAEVRVDGERHLEILRLVTAFDCGRIVNPENLRNQIEGAAVMGLGGALFEAVHFADGRILTPTLKEYRVPRMRDVPPIEVVLIDRPDLPSAGAGETPIVGIAPAIANAIQAATGRRVRSMPLAPDGIVR